MATGPVVEVEGLRQLRSQLRRCGDDLSDLKEANRRVGEMVSQWAAVRAPRRTGRLADSVRSTRQVGRARIQAGSSVVPYAGPIHWGWPARGIKAQPFVSEAAVETQPAWLPVYLSDIQKALDRVQPT